ncbi:hypothetical protein R6242_06320 [Iodobacter sp. CM08]|uniref:hypothetical protein n=1 Tax=Iodobacter sp. CM08 TaxID=3085902 RepID=UPI002980FEE9|nr:hypothetical protein [Iodobacter sp. CM08]MDW5416186.1 hypothetical protein [Iodobacter sp. CM08]
MLNYNPQFFYPPLLVSSDRLVRHPLNEWSSRLLSSFYKSIHNVDVVLPIMNQLALIETCRGNYGGAFEICVAQINFLKNLSKKNKSTQYLPAIIQPWINIARMDRWQNKEINSTEIYKSMSPDNRFKFCELNSRYGIEFSLGELCNLGENNSFVAVVNNVYWTEYARFLLRSNSHNLLQKHLQSGISSNYGAFIKISLIEVLILYQVKIDNFDSALKLLINIFGNCSEKYLLHFKVLELFVSEKSGRDYDKGVIDEIMLYVSLVERDSYGLNLISEISRVFKIIGLKDVEIELLSISKEIAEEINDEIILFYVMERLVEIGLCNYELFVSKFEKSSYSVIRKKLKLGNLPLIEVNRSIRIVDAVNYLAVLDYENCLNVLHEENIEMSGTI